MSGITRRGFGGAVGAAMLAAPLRASAQEPFSLESLETRTAILCETVKAMDGHLAGGPPPTVAEAVAIMSTLFDTLPPVFETLQAVEQGVTPDLTDPEMTRLAFAVKELRDCGDLYKKIARDWAEKFGPSPAGSSGGEAIQQAAAFTRHKVKVDYTWSAVVVLALVLLRGGRIGE